MKDKNQNLKTKFCSKLGLQKYLIEKSCNFLKYLFPAVYSEKMLQIKEKENKQTSASGKIPEKKCSQGISILEIITCQIQKAHGPQRVSMEKAH